MAAAFAPSVAQAIESAGTTELLLAVVSAPLVGLAEQLNAHLWGVEPWAIVAGTASFSLALAYLYMSTAYHRLPLTTRIRRTIFRLIRRLPPVKKKLAAEKATASRRFEEELHQPSSGVPDLIALPETGWEKDFIINQMKRYLEMGELDWKSGAMSGAVYDGSLELASLMAKVYEMMAWANPSTRTPSGASGKWRRRSSGCRVSCSRVGLSPAAV